MKYPENWDQLPRHERKKLRKALKRQEQQKIARVANIQAWVIRGVVAVALTAGGYFWWTNRSVLPPTNFTGHIEQSPESHILDKPMSILIQKHMIEHADGEGPPGVVINYNCEDFECEPELIEELADIANQYPEFVYVAPFPGMTKKLAITRFKKIETFDSFDKEALIRFIE
ncbi:hypothetical protein IH980_01015 [Patescibacteria group bacterium]|nr:hypothetical protein [Patescibacteria group bacterium]